MLDKTGLVAIDRRRADRLSRDGAIHLEQVIPPERVDEILALALKTQSEENFHHTKVFAILIEEMRLHRLVQSLFAESIYYIGWSNVMRERKATAAHLHDDAKGCPIPADGSVDKYFQVVTRPFDPIRHPTFPIYRLFIYLNDHTRHSGGTKVKRGSHKRHELLSAAGLRQILRGKFKNVMLPFFGYVNPMVKPGDAVLFNLRTRHSGHFVRLRRPFAGFALPPRLDNMIKRMTLGSRFGRKILNLFAYPFPDARTSVVIDFCVESDWARGFQGNRLLHPGNEKRRQLFFDCSDPAFVARLNAVGLDVLNAPALPKLEALLKAA
ncbi:MAG TPA: phytanoyl-CoA dioxygenase family protein [Pseudolabrys sp.]|jgi:hypothetical protein|nr:phytanoyl-CoA dioxygenase family protein [Pseudolabrys sp.]